MQIELKQGHAANITQREKPEGTIECHVAGGRILLNSDLADKVKDGDDVVVAGKLHENLLHAIAIKNISQGTTAQVDPTNNVLALGFCGFIGIISAVQSFNANAAGNSMGSIFLALVAAAGFAGIFIFVQRILDINKASSKVKYANEQ